jgi:hypothetical protein
MTTLAETIMTGVKTGLINARVAGPAKVVKFNSALQRVDVQLTIQQIINGENVSHTVLFDLPLVFPTAGGFSITFPVSIDDEVLILYSDRCIDGWLESGEVSRQITHRAHDISDGFAIVGVKSEPNAIQGYSEDHLEIRDDSGNQAIRLNSDGKIEIETNGQDVIIDGISWKTHYHDCPSGGGPSGPPQNI